MDEEEDFFDTSSLMSYGSYGRRRSAKEGDYISLSRNTIYHSAMDIEMDTLDGRENKSWGSFTRGNLCVDFVLAYEKNENNILHKKREVFEQHLEESGLILEREENQKIHFIKIHAPFPVLCQYAEVLKLRLPIKDEPIEFESSNVINHLICKFLDCLNVRLDPEKFPQEKNRLTAEFSRDKSYLFDMDDPEFFTTSTRITVVSYILEREKYGKEEQDKGIKKLLAEGVYKAAYPLHDGSLTKEGSQRRLLHQEWAQVNKWMKFQPIDNIKQYFGVKIALYFSWLGFYTHMLIPASIFGIISVLYGALTLGEDSISKDICSLNVTMCPLCDRYCDYWSLSDSCTYSKIARLVDNPATVCFAVFMSFWSALYLELWKRYSAEITHRWGLTGFDLQAEPPRPEYLTRLATAKKKKLNVVTHLCEPVVPFWRVRLPSLIISFTMAFFWILLAIGMVFGIVIYRMSLLTSNALYSDQSSYRIYVVPCTAGLLNLVCIIVMNYLYNYLAEWLTELELQRTQTEFDDSLALKIYMFQFVNYYSCIFYIAFLKGKFVGYPAKYNRVFGFRQEECNPGGCLMELTIQLAIIMIGNQALNSVLEMVIPLTMKLYNNFTVSAGLKRIESDDIIGCNQWTEDYKLLDLEPRGLFQEYLEMVLQYGFVTIFVTAFPLAPLFALINNVLEMRLDAKKMIQYYRRPVPKRVKDIGVWLPIMDFVGRLSVVSNAFIIAFSSHFIPKLVYMMKVNPERTDEHFLNFTLSYFDTMDFMNGTAPENPSIAPNICRYSEFRNPPTAEFKYKRPLVYWHILAARLAFIVVYQNLVSMVIAAVQWSIPDIPRKLETQIKREAYRTNEMILKHESEKIRERMKRHQNRNSAISDSAETHAEENGLHNRKQRNSTYHDIAHS